jgi:hypothetical protein
MTPRSRTTAAGTRKRLRTAAKARRIQSPPCTAACPPPPREPPRRQSTHRGGDAEASGQHLPQACPGRPWRRAGRRTFLAAGATGGYRPQNSPARNLISDRAQPIHLARRGAEKWLNMPVSHQHHHAAQERRSRRGEHLRPALVGCLRPEREPLTAIVRRV